MKIWFTLDEVVSQWLEKYPEDTLRSDLIETALAGWSRNIKSNLYRWAH